MTRIEWLTFTLFAACVVMLGYEITGNWLVGLVVLLVPAVFERGRRRT